MDRCAAWLVATVFAAGAVAAPPTPVPVDHHQHLLSPTMISQGQQPIDAKTLIAALDAAGIRRAVILSNAYRYGSPLYAISYPDEYPRVIAENDWTAREAAKYPKRLVAFRKVWLEPGRSTTVRMTIDPRATNHPLGVWDESAGRWVVRDGSYVVSVGTSSAGTFLSDTVRVRSR